MNRDHLTPEQRSWNMSRIRSKHTAPERIVRSLLHRLGYRFRLHQKFEIQPAKRKDSSLKTTARPLVIRPDITLPRHRTAIFVHGCFWHRHRGCTKCTTPTHRREWWIKKLEGNAARDKVYQRALRKLGWRVVVIWECALKFPANANTDTCVKFLKLRLTQT